MFERFTRQARAVVITAQSESTALGHTWIGPEHLLLGVLAQPGAPGVATLARAGVTPDTVRSSLVALGGPDRLGDADAQALRSLGIDLDSVRERAERNFGPDALEPGGGRPESRAEGRPGRQRFDRNAKRTLQRTLREAVSHGDRRLRVEHVMLGLLDPYGNRAVDVLRHLGTTPDTAREAVLGDLGRAA